MDNSSATETAAPAAPKARLVDAPVRTQNDALQLFVSFLNLAQKRGAFTLDESAKIWDCIKVFQTGGETEE